MAVQLKKFLPFLIFFLPLFAHASVISTPSNNIGLAAYWKFDDGSGSTAKDSSGNGLSGTLTGSPTWSAGKFSGALLFNSSGQYVTTGYTIPAQSSATSFTWSAWINQTSSGGSQVILGYRNGSTWVKLTPSSFEYGTGGLISNTIPTGQWVLETIVKNGSNFTYYQNGVVVGTATNSGTVGSHTFFIGTDPGFADGTPHYSIDDVRVYSRALSASEVKALYDPLSALMSTSYSPGSLASGLVGWWPFDGKTITSTVQDIVGGNNGDMIGFTSTTSAEVIGKIGQALKFNGTNQDIQFVSPISGTPSVITVCGWLSSNALSSTKVALSLGTSGTSIIWLGTSSSKWQFVTANNSFVQSSGGVSSGWHYLCGAYSGTTAYLYVDGVLSASGATTMASVTSAGIIGEFGSGGFFWSGSIDDVRIYNRALSQSEITRLYNLGQGTHINDSSASTTDGSSIGSGLVGLWTFDGKDMTSNVKDESGQGNNGDLVGFTSTTSAETIGKLGQALKFNGSNQYVDIPLATNPTAYTIAAWVKPADTTSRTIFFRTSSLNGGGTNFSHQLDTQGNVFSAYTFDSAGKTVTGSVTYTPGKWYFVVATAQNSGVETLYVNGVQDGTPVSVGTLWTGGNRYEIGSPTGVANAYWNGAVDDVRLYNRVLSASEVKQLYNLGK